MYKILLPVTTSPELVEQKLKDFSGHEKHLIVVNNWTNPDVHNLCKQFAENGAEVWDCRYNLGLAATWNLGMRRTLEDQADLLFIFAPSAILGKDVQYFIDHIYNLEDTKKECKYVLSPEAWLHAYVLTKKGIVQGGYFDENFWPIYYEDADYSHRSKFNGVGAGLKCLQMDGVKSISASISCNTDADLMFLHQHNCSRWTQYYLDKWGGDHTREIYETPFNNPNLHINDWTVDVNFFHPSYPEGFRPPPPSRRY